MLMIDPVQVIPGLLQQEYTINSSITGSTKSIWNSKSNCCKPSSGYPVTGVRDTGVQVAGQMIRNHLHAACHHARWSRVVPTLTNRHIAHRCEWCRERQNWGVQHWSHVLLSDESLFTLDFLDRCGQVWQQQNEQQDNVTMWFHDRFGSGLVMVWGSITMTDIPPTPYNAIARKGHWAVLPGQHTDTLCGPVDVLFFRTTVPMLTVHESSLQE